MSQFLMLVRRLRFESETGNLARVRAFVEGVVADGGVAAPERRRLVLAVDEAVTNVMEHGYAGEPGRPIEVEVAASPARVEVRIRDEGLTFDPSSAVPAAARAPGALPIDASGQLRTRGYGLILIHRLVDEVRYSRREARVNELLLVRQLGAAS